MYRNYRKAEMEKKDTADRKLRMYIVRHGETEWNVKRKFQGQLDSPLTEKGIEEIKNTAEKIKNVNFRQVYTSQLGRAIKSAEIILGKNSQKISSPIKLPELNEIHFGQWQGLSFDEIFEKYPLDAHNYFNDIKKYEAENINGEKLENGLERFLKGLIKIAENNDSGNVLVVTHGTVLELFIKFVDGKKYENLDERKIIKNGDYKIFTFEEGKFFKIEQEN